MPKTHSISTVFTVTGNGHFPVDMLRYDSCIPATESDAYKLLEDGERTVQLRKFFVDKKPSLTFERWRSFGWVPGPFKQEF